MEIDPAQISQPERYKLLIGCVVPRPIAFVSTISPDGRPNLAPFSFFTAVGSDPMLMLFCPANNNDGSEKDSLRNASLPAEGGVGEFVVNIVTESIARPMAATAEPLPYGESEFALAGLHETPSRRVRPARVAECPVSFECRTTSIIRTNPGRPSGGNIVIGEVVHVFVRDDVIDARLHTDPGKLAAIGRMGGLGYCTTRQRFNMPPGKAALDLPDPIV